jgi:transforming growth factor-beta-induced protein
MKSKYILLLVCLCMAGVLISGCTSPTANPVVTTPTVNQAVPPTPTPAISESVSPAKTILSTAAADSRFTTLVAAIQTAKLDSSLSGPGPFTVFAPDEDAFKKLPHGTLQSLLLDPQGRLKQTLLYHVVQGNYMTSDLANVTTLKTLQGGDLTIRVINDTVYVNNARVAIDDIRTDNGVIHVIDTVLILPVPSAMINATNKTGM